MGILSLLFVFILLFVILMVLKQKLGRLKGDCRQSFGALKFSLSNRHLAVKRVLEASLLYLSHEQEMEEELFAACEKAEKTLAHAAKSFSASSMARLCRAETELNRLLRQLQNLLENNAQAGRDKQLQGHLEMLDAAENNVVSSRRTYNRHAERYNQHLLRFPATLFARFVGHTSRLGLVNFKDNNVAEISENLLV